MFLTFAILISFLAGAFIGKSLAKKGVTAETALQQYQRQVYWISFAALSIGTLITVLMIAGKKSPWFPSFLLLYPGAYFWIFILLICCFSTGFLIFLEKSGWRDKKRLQQLILFLIVSLFAIAFLLYQNLPITGLIQPAQISQGVVLQTTPYSCSSASIATLARLVKPELQITELDVVKLAKTNRQGTSILGEIKAMQRLGLAPQYERNLKIEDLVSRQQLAILHVMETHRRNKNPTRNCFISS
ncbi:MAG: hypothetical protein RSE13_09730 [Planktothrix sp. GU0601_MAG3]|nr:MAG: hypothetical protein RSE13_09730 [Planktothrix sp. GU0601_MAG3]